MVPVVRDSLLCIELAETMSGKVSLKSGSDRRKQFPDIRREVPVTDKIEATVKITGYGNYILLHLF